MLTRMIATLSLIGMSSSTIGSPPSDSLAELRSDVAYLASDELGGRLPGSPGGTLATTFIIAKMKAAGLSPGYFGRWKQEVPLVSITGRADANFSVRGNARVERLETSKDAIFWTKLPRAQVKLETSEIVFVGYGINAPERGWNDYAGSNVRGKTVLILANDPDWRAEGNSGLFGGKTLTYYGRYTYKYEEAARQGAAAAIIIHDTEAAGYPFQVLINTNSGPKIDLASPAVQSSHAKVEGWITMDAAQRFLDRAGYDLSELSDAAGKKGFRARSLGAHFNVRISNQISRFKSENIVGILPGRERPDESFFYSAHWDHMGKCPPVSGHAICNGAIDNATGVAGILAIARRFAAGTRPKRSILFLALTGEEQGLLGSSYFVSKPSMPLEHIAGGINLDVLNVFAPTRDVMIMYPGLSSLESIYRQAAIEQGRRVSPDMAPNQGLFFRSDQLSFSRAGIPTLFASSGLDYARPPWKGGLLPYFQNTYHTSRDTYDPDWNWEGALADLELYWKVGERVANGSEWPTWNEGAEFRKFGLSRQ